MTEAEHDTASDAAPVAASQKRPNWPTPVGVLSIVFASIGLLCGAGGVAMIPISGTMMQQGLGDLPPPPTMTLGAPILVAAAGGVVANVVLLVAGIMLVTRRRAARATHLVYAVIGVIITFVGVWATMEMQRAMDAWLADYGDREVAGGSGQTWNDVMSQGQAFQALQVPMTLTIGLAWPVFCMIWFGMVKRDADEIPRGRDDEDPYSK